MNDKEFLGYFDELSNENEQKRIESGQNIVKVLLAQVHAKSEKRQSKFGENISQDLEYTLKRLILGSVSQQTAVQYSFSAPIKEILRKFDNIGIMEYLEFVMEECNVKKSIKKSETNHFVLGNILCIFALQQSKRIDQATNIVQIMELIYSQLFEHMQEHPWSSQLCAKIIGSSIQENEKVVKEKIKIISNLIKSKLKNPSVSIIQIIIQCYFASKRFSQKEFSLVSFLDSRMNNSKNICQILQQSLETHPKPHKCIKWMVQYINESQNNKFWQELQKNIYQELIDPSQINLQNYFLVLVLFNYYVKYVEFDFTSLNDKIISLWLKNISSQNSSMRLIAEKIKKNIISKLRDDQLGDFLKILKKDPTFRFNQKNELAKAIFAKMEKESLLEYFEYLKNKSDQSTDPQMLGYYINEIYVLADMNWNTIGDKNFIKICRYLVQQTSSHHITKVLNQQLQDDIKEGNATKDEMIDPALITQHTEQVFQFFYSLINTILKSAIDGEKKINEIRYQQANLLMKLIDQLIDEIINNNDQFKDLKIVFDKVRQNFKPVLKSLKENNKEDNISKQKYSLLILMLGIIIQAFQYYDENFEYLSELEMVYKDISIDKSSEPLPKKKVKKEKQEVNPIQVLNDIIISLLTKSQTFMRDLVKKCFNDFINQIDEICIKNLTDVISRNNKEYIEDMEEEQDEQ